MKTEEDFYVWLSSSHPNVVLVKNQKLLVDYLFSDGGIFSLGRGAGKSFILNLLKEYDDQTNQHGEN